MDDLIGFSQRDSGGVHSSIVETNREQIEK